MVTAHVAITGAHHTGKTTLARRIEMELRADGYSVIRVGGAAKRAAELGFPKMTRHTAASTGWIIASAAAAALEAMLTADVVICEHTAADALAYLLAACDHRAEEADPDDLRHLTTIAGAYSRRHTAVLATAVDPAVPLGAHPAKDPDYTNKDFRTAVDGHLHRLLAEFGIDHVAVDPSQPAGAVQLAVDAVTKALA